MNKSDKSALICGFISVFTLGISRDFFSSRLFYDLYTRHTYATSIVLSVIVTLHAASIYLIVKLVLELRKKNKNEE